MVVFEDPGVGGLSFFSVRFVILNHDGMSTGELSPFCVSFAVSWVMSMTVTGFSPSFQERSLFQMMMLTLPVGMFSVSMTWTPYTPTHSVPKGSNAGPFTGLGHPRQRYVVLTSSMVTDPYCLSRPSRLGTMFKSDMF